MAEKTTPPIDERLQRGGRPKSPARRCRLLCAEGIATEANPICRACNVAILRIVHMSDEELTELAVQADLAQHRLAIAMARRKIATPSSRGST